MPHPSEVIRMMERRGVYDPRDFHHYFYDFDGDAGDTLANPWATQDTSSTGTPTLDFVTDVASGVYQAKHDSTGETQEIGLNWGDHLGINLSRAPIIEARIKLNAGASGFSSADQRMIFGVGSDYASTLDNVTTNAWFRIEGANYDILVEGDDGSTDTDDQDSSIDLSDDTWARFIIDFGDLSAVKFYVNNLQAGTVDISGVSANTMVQPHLIMQKDAGTETPDLRIDWFDLVQERS